MVSDLSTWTALISQQQEETARAQREENEQLERDIALARQARTARQSGFLSPQTARPSTFIGPPFSSSSLSGMPSSSTSGSREWEVNKLGARPTSLAGMLGSSSPGPRLTRAPQAINTEEHQSPAPFSNRGVGLTGMSGGLAKTDSSASRDEQGGTPRRWTPATVATPSTLAKPSMRSVAEPQEQYEQQQPALSKPGSGSGSSSLPFERRTSPSSASAVAQSSASTSSLPFSKRSTTLPAPTTASTSQPLRSTSPLDHRSKPSLSSHASYSSPTSTAPSLLRPIPKPDPNPPGISPPAAPPSEMFLRPSSQKAPTASLTRLKGRGIVEEQLRKSKLRNEADDDGALAEFGSPSMGSGGWAGAGSGGAKSSRSAGGSGGFPRSSVPERSQTQPGPPPRSGAHAFLPTSDSSSTGAKDAFPVLRPTRQHRPSASISQLPTQPVEPLAPTTSRHRPTSSVGRLPPIGALTNEAASSIDRQMAPRVRTAGKAFQAKHEQDSLLPSASSSAAPTIPTIPGSPRVSVKSFVRSVESPVSSDVGPGRRLFPARSKTAPVPPPHIMIPTIQPTQTSAVPTLANPATSIPVVSSPSLANPYSTFYTPSPTTARPASPIKSTSAVSNAGLGLPGIATIADLSSPRTYNKPETAAGKPLPSAGLPGIASTGQSSRAGVTSPIKDRFEALSHPQLVPERSSSSTKPNFSGLPSSPTKTAFDLRHRDDASVTLPPVPKSPTKTGRTSPFTFTPSSPTKAKMAVPDSPTKATAALPLTSATPVRVRRGKSASGAELSLVPTEAEEKAADPAASSPTGGLSHPTRDRARKPKSKNRPSLVSPSASAASLVQTSSPVSPMKTRPPPLSPVKAIVVQVASPTSPTKKLASPVTPTFQNLAQRKSVWGDQPPIGVRPLGSHARGENSVEKEAPPFAKGPKGTFGGKALPGMVPREDEIEPAAPVLQAVRKPVPAPVAIEDPKVIKAVAATRPAPRSVVTPLPSFSVRSILASHPPTSLSSTAPPLTLSLEVLSILPSGQTSTLPASSAGVPWIFYESELLAIVHRSKSRETGLVSSMVWGWQGRRWADERGRGAAKLKDIGSRLSAQVTEVRQGEEGEELMLILGGKLVTRQGPREHFAADNTSLYTVQESRGSLFVDEVDLLPTSLTSRHSLVLSVLSQVFLYHGRGSLRSERIVGRQYAALLAKDSPAAFIELEESDGKKSDDSELFWMCFGESDEAEGSRADHWKWRAKAGSDEMRVWKVDADAGGKEKAITPVIPSSADAVFSGTGVKLVLLAFELFILVPADARSRTRDIELAIKVAEAISLDLATSKPFAPPVHTLILPSSIPADLKTYFRGLDEDEINGGRAPEHMNVFSASETKGLLAAEGGLDGEGWIKTK